MTAYLIGGGIVLVVLGGAAWALWYAGGRDERTDRAEDEADASRKQAERMAGPMPGRVERARAALRELRRRGVRLPPEVAEAALRRAERGGPDRDRDGSAG